MVKIPTNRGDAFCSRPDATIRCILLYGSNEGLVRKRAETCIRSVVDDSRDPFRVTTVDTRTLTKEPGSLADEAAALSLTGGKRVVRVLETTDALTKAFEFCCSLVATDSLVVAEASALTPRSTLRKFFEQNEKCAAIPCYEEKAADISRLIDDFCLQYRITAEPAAVEWLAERLGNDRRQVEGELYKIATYLDPEGHGGALLSTTVAQTCVGDANASTAETIALSVTSGDLEGLDRAMARAIYTGAQPISVLRSVSRRLLRLHLATSSVEQGNSVQAAMSNLRPPIFPREKRAFAAEMRHWTSELSARALNLIVVAERDCKTSVGPTEAISWHALLRVSRAARAARR